MNIQLEKLEIMKLLLETENPTIISSIKKIFQKEKKDWWSELPDYAKEAIEEGEKDIENGNVFTFEEVMSELRKL